MSARPSSGRLGFGPMAPPPAPTIRRAPRTAAPAPRAGSGSAFGGLPCAGRSLPHLLPIVVYVISYIPWASREPPAVAGSPSSPGTSRLAARAHRPDALDLTESMYHYHNNLRAAHPASSPWWAWPLDLKPVWFYQGASPAEHAASIYDAGNLVIWWLAIPALGFRPGRRSSGGAWRSR